MLPTNFIANQNNVFLTNFCFFITVDLNNEKVRLEMIKTLWLRQMNCIINYKLALNIVNFESKIADNLKCLGM